MNRTTAFAAPAKLNLFLRITGRRPDGFHDLQTVFQLLDWGDKLAGGMDCDTACSAAHN